MLAAAAAVHAFWVNLEFELAVFKMLDTPSSPCHRASVQMARKAAAAAESEFVAALSGPHEAGPSDQGLLLTLESASRYHGREQQPQE